MPDFWRQGGEEDENENDQGGRVDGTYKEFLNHLKEERKVGCVVLCCSDHEDDMEFKRCVMKLVLMLCIAAAETFHCAFVRNVLTKAPKSTSTQTVSATLTHATVQSQLLHRPVVFPPPLTFPADGPLNEDDPSSSYSDLFAIRVQVPYPAAAAVAAGGVCRDC